MWIKSVALRSLFTPFVGKKSIDVNKYIESDQEFHNVILRLSGNQILKRFEILSKKCFSRTNKRKRRIAGAAGSGLLINYIYRKKGLKSSRKIPAVFGFILASFGMLMVTQSASVTMAVAVFGADMTLSPSWAFCIDIGKENAGLVSGTMNMAGNLGAFVTIPVYPYLFDWTGSNIPLLYITAAMSAVAIVMWSFMDPK